MCSALFLGKESSMRGSSLNHSAKQTDGELEICVAGRSMQDIGELMAAGYPQTRVRLLVLLLFLEVAVCIVFSS